MHLRYKKLIISLPMLVISFYLTPNSSKDKGKVSCGNHGAESCSKCPFDKKFNGFDRGEAWCNGECSWEDGKCSPKGKDIFSLEK